MNATDLILIAQAEYRTWLESQNPKLFWPPKRGSETAGNLYTWDEVSAEAQARLAELVRVRERAR